MAREILVDGYNVIRRDPMFQAMRTRSLEGARELLITQLVQRYRHTPHQVIVVFDGAGTHEQVLHDRRIRIIYSRQGESADSVIVRLAAQARREGREVEMYSDDGAVRDAVTQQGGAARSSQQLTSHLNAAPRDVAKRAQHRLRMRRLYGLDPACAPDDESDDPPARRSKKKKRRR